MPTKFNEFFQLAADADDIQKRVFAVIGDAETTVECYQKMFEYVIGGIKWWSKQYRHGQMDNTVDLTGLNQQQLDDAKNHFGTANCSNR